jgi:hypothetical protein
LILETGPAAMPMIKGFEMRIQIYTVQWLISRLCAFKGTVAGDFFGFFLA